VSEEKELWIIIIEDLKWEKQCNSANSNKQSAVGKSSESVQCAMLKAFDACADMGQL